MTRESFHSSTIFLTEILPFLPSTAILLLTCDALNSAAKIRITNLVVIVYAMTERNVREIRCMIIT